MSVDTPHLSPAVQAALATGFLRARNLQISTTFTTGVAQPASLGDALFAGEPDAAAPTGRLPATPGTDVAGLVIPIFADAATETGGAAGQASLGASAANQPYNDALYAGFRGVPAVLLRADRDQLRLRDVLSTAIAADANAQVYGYVSRRSDLGADLRYRLWFYYRRASDGREEPFTPDISLAACLLYVPKCLLLSGIPARDDLTGTIPSQAAAGIGPKSLTQTSIQTAAAGAILIGDAAAEGAAETMARADHTHSFAAPAAPANVDKSAAVAGVATAAARADHKHDTNTAAPGATGVAAASAEGVATTLARSDHVHQSNTAPANVTKAAAVIGVSGEPARADHKHDATTAAPATIGTANAEGAATSLARSDHVHDHGVQTSGTLHAVATGAVAGFMSAADKTKIDDVAEPIKGTATSSDAGGQTQTLATIAVGVGETVTIRAAIVGRRTDAGTSGAYGEMRGGFRRDGGVVTQIGSTDHFVPMKDDDGAGATVQDLSISGTNVLVRWTGIATQTWNAHTRGTVARVT